MSAQAFRSYRRREVLMDLGLGRLLIGGAIGLSLAVAVLILRLLHLG